MMDWDDLRFFAELARQGSLSATARRLRTDHSTVARRITKLEQALGLKLFDRMPRGYALTEEGRLLAGRTAALERAVVGIGRLAGGTGEVVTGQVRISAPPALASLWLMPRLGPLRERYPDLVLDIAGAVGAARLSHREADLAVRLSRPTDTALVARKLGTLRYGLYGARGYLEATAEKDRVILAYDEELDDVPQQRWLRAIAGNRPFAVLANDLVSLLSGVRAGMGLSALPHILAEAAPELVCLADGPEAARDMWLVVHPDLRRAARVRAVMDYLAEITAPLRHGTRP